MKRLALLLALVICLCACTAAPIATTQPPVTTVPVETTLPPEPSVPAEPTTPVETTTPTAQDFSEYEALLDFSADPNWLARSLACIYENPAEINLEYLFYLGVNHPGSWNEICEESRQSLIDQGFWQELDIQIMPVSKLEEILQSTFGISLADVTIPENWGYIETENAYCSNHSDAFIPYDFTIIDVIESHDGTLEIHCFYESYYNIAAENSLYTIDLILTLHQTADGYQAISNVLTGVTEYDSLYDRELIDIISTEEALKNWAISEKGLDDLAAHSPAFAELMTRSTAKDTFAWYGPECLKTLKSDPESAEYAEYLALLIVTFRAS
jgi:hypothetical protein